MIFFFLFNPELIGCAACLSKNFLLLRTLYNTKDCYGADIRLEKVCKHIRYQFHEVVSFYRIVELPRRPGLTRPISGTYESGAAHGHRPLQQAEKKHGKCKMTQADAKGNDDLQGARFLRNFTSSKSRSTPDRDSLTATSALRSVLRRFCLCSDSVLTPF